jgi:hypothetical protein
MPHSGGLGLGSPQLLQFSRAFAGAPGVSVVMFQTIQDDVNRAEWGLGNEGRVMA